VYERSPGTKHYHVRRHYQLALLAYTHIQEALLPTFDHLMSTDLENKWFFSGVGKTYAGIGGWSRRFCWLLSCNKKATVQTYLKIDESKILPSLKKSSVVMNRKVVSWFGFDSVSTAASANNSQRRSWGSALNDVADGSKLNDSWACLGSMYHTNSEHRVRG
jgi:hypothetical protein